MTLPATDCAFEGFRLTRRAPKALLAWALAYGVFFTLFFLVAAPHLVTVMSLVTALEGNSNPSIEEIQPLMQACIAAGAHYLDITAEINVYRLAERLHDDAAAASDRSSPGRTGAACSTDLRARRREGWRAASCRRLAGC